MHTHRLQLPKHQHFLDEKRHDPVTGDAFKEGDEIVFCANCGSAFLKSSWEYIDRTHCEQHETLKNFPEASALDLNVQPELDDEILFCEYEGAGEVVKKGKTLGAMDSVLGDTSSWRTSGILVGFVILIIISIIIENPMPVLFPIILLVRFLMDSSPSQPSTKFIEENMFAIGTSYFHAFKKKWHYKSVEYIQVRVRRQHKKGEEPSAKWFVALVLKNGEKHNYESTAHALSQGTRECVSLLYGLLGASQHTTVYFKSQFPGDMAFLEKLQNEYEGDLRELK